MCRCASLAIRLGLGARARVRVCPRSRSVPLTTARVVDIPSAGNARATQAPHGHADTITHLRQSRNLQSPQGTVRHTWRHTRTRARSLSACGLHGLRLPAPCRLRAPLTWSGVGDGVVWRTKGGAKNFNLAQPPERSAGGGCGMISRPWHWPVIRASWHRHVPASCIRTALLHVCSHTIGSRPAPVCPVLCGARWGLMKRCSPPFWWRNTIVTIRKMCWVARSSPKPSKCASNGGVLCRLLHTPLYTRHHVDTPSALDSEMTLTSSSPHLANLASLGTSREALPLARQCVPPSSLDHASRAASKSATSLLA